MAKESYAGKINRKLGKKLRVVEVAAGREPADLVLKNATYVNVYCNTLSHGDIAAATSHRLFQWAAKLRSIPSHCLPLAKARMRSLTFLSP